MQERGPRDGVWGLARVSEGGWFTSCRRWLSPFRGSEAPAQSCPVVLTTFLCTRINTAYIEALSGLELAQANLEALRELVRDMTTRAVVSCICDLYRGYTRSLTHHNAVLRVQPAFSGLVITPTGVRRSTLEEMVTELENAVSKWKDLLDEHTPEWIRRVEARRKNGAAAGAGAGRLPRGRPAARK